MPEIEESPSKRRRLRRIFNAERRAARVANLRQWLDGRAKAAQKRHAEAIKARKAARIDRRPEWLQDVDGLGEPMLVVGPFTTNREISRAFRKAHGGLRGSTRKSGSQMRKLPPSIATHYAVRDPRTGKLVRVPASAVKLADQGSAFMVSGEELARVQS